MALDEKWNSLKSQYPDHPAMAEEAVYSLPTELIEEIRRAAPTLIPAEALAFERDLAMASPHGGFFRGRTFAYPPLRAKKEEAGELDDIAKNTKSSADNIRAMLAEDMQHRGYSQASIKQHFNALQQSRQMVDDWRWSYAGWLVTNPEFQRQVQELATWKMISQCRPSPPQLSVTLHDPSPVHTKPTDYEEQCSIFLRSWNLESMATWELPIPMRPETVEPNLYPAQEIQGAGISLFVPWYLLRDKSLRLSDIAEHQQMVLQPPTLRDWLDPKPKNWGPGRFTTMLKVFIYVELCLRCRYPTRCQGNLSKLDSALATYLTPDRGDEGEFGDETIRKIRLEMQRRLSPNP